jgi:hypothetical protein
MMSRRLDIHRPLLSPDDGLHQEVRQRRQSVLFLRRGLDRGFAAGESGWIEKRTEALKITF